MNDPRRSVILDTCVRAEFHTLLLVSLYLLFAGHNQPGGGFAGGLVASCAFYLRYIADGERGLRQVIRVDPPAVMGVGLLLALGTGTMPLLLGDAFFESAILELHPPLLGTVKVTSVLFFDIGVYVVVVGMALFLLEQFGGADGSDPFPEESTDAPDTDAPDTEVGA